MPRKFSAETASSLVKALQGLDEHKAVDLLNIISTIAAEAEMEGRRAAMSELRTEWADSLAMMLNHSNSSKS